MRSSKSLQIRTAYALEMANFLNVLTADEFYTSRHPEAYAHWAPQLSEASRDAMRTAVAVNGSTMLGPYVSYLIAAVPGFAQMNLGALLALPRAAYEGLDSHWADEWGKFEALRANLGPVVAELEELGFRSWWEAERLPLIHQATASLERYLDTLEIDLGASAAAMLGKGQADSLAQIELYLCTFARPHGMKIHGWRYVSDVSFPQAFTVRIALHEMFHPPYQVEELRQEADALIVDPLFQESFRNLNPQFGYNTADSFLEENVVEAMELFVSARAGLVDDPLGYLLQHDEGSHKLSVVLLKYFREVARGVDEPFAAYFRRVVSEMPVGGLQAVYDAEVAGR